MPACPSEATVLAFVDGELSAARRGELEAHLAACDECRMLVSELARGAADEEHVEPAFATTAPASTDPGRRTPAPNVGPVRTGDVLAGKYVVERVLGVGGMGVVVAAMHRELAQRVALKFLLPAAFEAPGAHARFLREARAAARIQSEHVARVKDVGTLDSGAPYLVMEYLDGTDLGAHLRAHGAMDPTLVVELVLQACEALAEAHAMGIVHRDLKPANLFLTKRADGTPFVKVLDFGISKAEGGSQGTLTTQSSMMGSPRYMSPEQLRSARDVDARTDVWALGVLLYELVSGKPPFDGESMLNVCTAIATTEPPRLRTVCPRAPEALERAVAACLVKDRDQRTPSVAALAESLRAVASPAALASIARITRIGTTTSSEVKPITASAGPPPPKSRATYIFGGVAAVALLAFGATRLATSTSASVETGAGSAAVAASTSTSAPVETGAGSAAVAASAVTATPTATPTSTASPPALRAKRKADPAPVPSSAVAVVHASADAGAPRATSPFGESGLLDRK